MLCWFYFKFFRVSVCMPYGWPAYWSFVGVARKWPYQLVQSPEVSWSRWPGWLQSSCSVWVGSLALLCHTQVRKLFRPCMTLAVAQGLAG